HHPEVALHVGADVFGMTRALRLRDVVAGLLAHARLERVDFRQHRQRTERTDQLGEIAGHEGLDHLLPGFGRLFQTREVIRDHFLLEQHRPVLLHCGHQAAPQSLIESENVPACSRNCWNWPLFSAYLNAMHGMLASSAPVRSIGWSRSAGSQKEAVAKMIPSARQAATRSRIVSCLPLGWIS